jgi:hypothetical protein
VEVLHGNLAATTAGVRAGLRFTPGERENVDLVGVLGVFAFGFDPLDFQEIMNSLGLPFLEI